MLLFRNRLVLGIIWKTVKVVFTVVYTILSFFSLQYTVLLGLVGVVLYFTGTLSASRVVLIIYLLLLVFSVVYAIISSIRKLLGLDKKVKRSKGVQIVEKGEEQVGEQVDAEQTAKVKAEKPVQVENFNQRVSNSPKYFRVKQNPSLLMAEFDDRFELYRVEQGKLKKIRTDYKKAD